VKIRPYIVQNKTDSGTRSFRPNRSQSQKQSFNFAPFDITINRIGKDCSEHFPVLTVHTINNITFCYHCKHKTTEKTEKISRKGAKFFKQKVILPRRAGKGILGIGFSVGHLGEKEPELDFILVFFIYLGYNKLI